MDRKILIVGHGLAGCVLALTFYRKNIPFKLIGLSLPGEASMASSGLIAPVTGRRYVKTWKIDEYIAKALDFYNWTEEIFNKKYFFPVEIVRFLSNEEAIIAWNKRLRDEEYANYISDKKYDLLTRFNKPYGIITGCYRLDTPGWLTAARNFLISQNLLEWNKEPYLLNDDRTEKVIFATGAVDLSVAHGIIPNKGEALIVSMPDWDIPLIMKEEVFIVPLAEKDLYWVGSYYQPWPEDSGPSEEGKNQILESLRNVYHGSLQVIEHLSGIRPTVDDRRPLIGALPGYPGQFMFNGMGTKGTSLAPYWAEQMAAHLTENLPLPKEVSPARYVS